MGYACNSPYQVLSAHNRRSSQVCISSITVFWLGFISGFFARALLRGCCVKMGRKLPSARRVLMRGVGRSKRLGWAGSLGFL